MQKENVAFKKKKLMNMEEIKNNVRNLTHVIFSFGNVA